MQNKYLKRKLFPKKNDCTQIVMKSCLPWELWPICSKEPCFPWELDPICPPITYDMYTLISCSLMICIYHIPLVIISFCNPIYMVGRKKIFTFTLPHMWMRGLYIQGVYTSFKFLFTLAHKVCLKTECTPNIGYNSKRLTKKTRRKFQLQVWEANKNPLKEPYKTKYK